MKYLIGLFLLGLCACGSNGGSAASSVNSKFPTANDLFLCNRQNISDATYSDGTGTTPDYTFNTDCTGSSQFCGMTFQRQITNEGEQIMTLIIQTSNNKSGCLPVGTYVQCTWNGHGAYELDLSCPHTILNVTNLPATIYQGVIQ